MKLVQLNIWGGRLGNQIVELLRQEAPDLVCLQETINVDGDAALAMSVQRIAAESGFNRIFHSPVFSFNLMNKTAEFGNAILAKQDFARTNTIFTNLEYKPGFDFDTDDYNIRNLQHVVVDVHGTAVNILNHHGHHVHAHKDGDAETLRQCKMIAEYIATLDGPVLLAGDFNLAPHSQSLEILNRQLTNLSVAHKLKTTRTNLTRKTEVCDYIFVNKQVTVREFHASDEVTSDHKALVVDFDV